MSATIAENSRVSNGEPATSFVINLSASTSPMALTSPTSAEMKRFTFFVTRQREDGRERFRLHMGYFSTQLEAENLLEAVRDVYPAAWVGPAPTTGTTRRWRAPRDAVMPVVVPAPVVAVPVVTAPVAAAPVVAAPVVAAPVVAAALESPPTVVKLEPQQPVQDPAALPILDSMSNVRDVIAKLDASAAGAPQVAVSQAVVRQREPQAPVSAVKVLQILETRREALASVPTPAPALLPTQDIRNLPPLKSPYAGLEKSSTVPVVTPEDTQTLTDIRLDAQNNAPPCFAVQLVWSVSPIDVAKLPHLAIFDAYTLYNVEGNRQGRKWFGLRLGFFTDPASATQVAHYVRSDYQTVAVVPVATKERDSAGGDGKRAQLPRLGSAVAPAKPELQIPIEKEGLRGFELLADDRPVPAKRDAELSAPKVDGKVEPSPAIQTPKLGVAKATGKRVTVRKSALHKNGSEGNAKSSLESTLEILGASTLSLDESREIINDPTVRKPLNRKGSGGSSRFGRLLSRLSGS
jgi:hypothetical protein